MITPIVREEDWLAGLKGLLEWQPQRSSIVLVCPHPDDETLGAGGLIASLTARSIPVTVVAVTNGEAAYPDHADLGRLRMQEHEQALLELGVAQTSTVRLGLPDSDVSSSEDALMDMLVPLFSDATHVLAPWLGDFHPDHEACGRAAAKAASLTGAALSFYVFWTWHRGTLDVLNEVSFRSFSLSKSAMHKRDKALECHRSQLYRDGGDPILPEYLLAPMQRPFEVFIDA